MTNGPDDIASSGSPSVGDLGEFGLIERLAALVPGSSAVVGIGDDAAVLDVGGPDYLLVTVDMLVEHVHFELTDTPPELTGRRALAVNVSDIAAMGGEPTFALVSLALPPSCSARFVEALYRGLATEAGLTGTGIVGGNVTATNGPICVDVTVLGRVPRDEVVLRSGAQPGDVLVVTGTLGAAAARRMALSRHEISDPALVSRLENLPSVPQPRIRAARTLAAGRLAHAMMDLSDGLSGDVRHMSVASEVGAVIQAHHLPLSTATKAIAGDFGISPVSLALSGGEDYELLIAMSADHVERARGALGDLALTVIGSVVPSADGISLEDESGERQQLLSSGWTHF